VQVTARHPVHSVDEGAVAALESPFRLGPMDETVFAFVPIQGVFVYRKPSSKVADSFIPVERLQKALAHLLSYYPHLTGRFHFNPVSRTPEINRLGAGVELLEARCDITLAELAARNHTIGQILVTDLPDCGNALTPPFNASLEGVCRDPILAVQHTRFACGGVALGIRVHHMVCDAAGFFLLARHLSEIYRSLPSHPTLTDPPIIHSYLRDVSVLSYEEQRKAREYKPTAYYYDANPTGEVPTQPKDDSTSNTEQSMPEKPGQPPVIGRVLRFTGDDLQRLKQLATNPTAGDDWISTFEALSAYLYQKAYRARIQLLLRNGASPSAAADQLNTGFWASINVRDSRYLNMPTNYFPNAIYPPYAVFPHELLASAPLWKVAKALHNLVRGVDAQQVEQTTRWVALQPDKSRIKVDFTFADGNFTVSQWSGFGMYPGMDFDVDERGDPISPALVAPPFTEVSRVDGLAMIMSTEEDLQHSKTEGRGKKPSAVDVNLTLSEPVWAVLQEDAEFMKHC
ncbi:hypothetical protein P170DRAFT_339443, partial [Aspergillus steynii IBT 23096]